MFAIFQSPKKIVDSCIAEDGNISGTELEVGVEAIDSTATEEFGLGYGAECCKVSGEPQAVMFAIGAVAAGGWDTLVCVKLGH